MIYRWLADVVVVVHFAYVAFVIVAFGLILIGLALRWRWVRNFWFRTIHLLAIGIVAVQAVAGVLCPLTTLEAKLRTAAGETSAEGSFVGRWMHELLFVDAPAWVFTTCYCLFGAAVLLVLILAPPKWPWKRRAHAPRA
jgi:hypothetical protein